MRLAIVSPYPGQHFCPLYRALAETGNVDLRVFFSSDKGVRPYFDRDFGTNVQWSADILQGFDHFFLAEGAAAGREEVRAGPRQLFRALDSFNPAVVQVYGLRSSASRIALLWARIRRRKLVLVTDSDLKGPWPLRVRFRRKLTLPAIYRLVDLFLAIGDENERFYHHYGVPLSKLARCPLPIDSVALDSPPIDRATVRASLDVPPEVPLAIVVGKLTAMKSADHVISALRLLDGDVRLSIAFVGDGPSRPKQSEITNLGPGKSVVITGFVRPDQLVSFYRAADFLVHPSGRDHHPLAITEAVYCGLPLVVSDRVASIGPTDDVRPMGNALVYQYGAIGDLARCLGLLTTNGFLRNELARKSREIGRDHEISLVAARYDWALRPLLPTGT
jgi:glycosyltransferase involved in cell wall biosynthesis